MHTISPKDAHGVAPSDRGYTMPLKVQAITNDPINRIAIIRFGDVLDEHPKLQAVFHVPFVETQTLADVHTEVKALARSVLEEAMRLCR